MTTPRLLVFVVLAMFLASGAHAAFLFDWTTVQPHWMSRPDATGDQVGLSGRDITKVWWGADETYQYFRLDLDLQPSALNGSGNMYGVYVDAFPGVGGAATNWIPSQLIPENVDLAVIVAFASDFTSPQLMKWDTGTSAWQSLPGMSFTRQADGSDYALEWRVPIGTAPSYYAPMSFWGGVVNLGPTTLDITNENITPEPTTMALLGLGLGGLYLKRRRSRS